MTDFFKYSGHALVNLFKPVAPKKYPHYFGNTFVIYLKIYS